MHVSLEKSQNLSVLRWVIFPRGTTSVGLVVVFNRSSFKKLECLLSKPLVVEKFICSMLTLKFQRCVIEKATQFLSIVLPKSDKIIDKTSNTLGNKKEKKSWDYYTCISSSFKISSVYFRINRSAASLFFHLKKKTVFPELIANFDGSYWKIPLEERWLLWK